MNITINRQRPAVGDKVLVLDADTNHQGKIGTISSDDETSLPFYVKGLYGESDSGYWMREDHVALTPNEGDRVVIDRPDTDWHGKLGKFVRISADRGMTGYVTFEDGGEGWFPMTQIVRFVPEDSPEVATLKAELARAQARLTEQQQRYRSDMGHIESTMRDVKGEQGWCDEGTNAVIDRINEGLTGGWEFDRYESEFEVPVTVTGTITTRTSVTVTATSLEEAREMVRRDPSDFVDDADDLLTDAARSVSFEDVEIELRRY